MQKSIFAVANIYETRIEMGQYLFHPAQVDISYSVLLVALFAMEFDEEFLFE